MTERHCRILTLPLHSGLVVQLRLLLQGTVKLVFGRATCASTTLYQESSWNIRQNSPLYPDVVLKVGKSFLYAVFQRALEEKCNSNKLISMIQEFYRNDSCGLLHSYCYNLVTGVKQRGSLSLLPLKILHDNVLFEATRPSKTRGDIFSNMFRLC